MMHVLKLTYFTEMFFFQMQKNNIRYFDLWSGETYFVHISLVVVVGGGGGVG